MTDLYCVFGNPIGHSRSPAIHTRFAAQTAQAMGYVARLAPLDDFAGEVARFAAEGGRGANVTVPFKEQAFALCATLSERAQLAGAVNTLVRSDDGRWQGDNTDGAGLLRDITVNLGVELRGLRILLLGAGGAARGVIGPLLAEAPAGLHLANRTVDKAAALIQPFVALQGKATLTVSGFAEIPADQPFDVVINATSASLGGENLPISGALFGQQTLAYDMMYGKTETPFLAQARQAGAGRCADGLGMLVEQAAEAFFLWRGVRPDGAQVLQALRTELQGA